MPAARKRKVIMVWNAARGGMRSVVEAYRQDGFLDQEKVHLVAAYDDGTFAARQWLLLKALAVFARLLLAGNVSLVHVHAAMRGSFWRKGLFVSLAHARGVPVLLHLHGSEFRAFFESQPQWRKRLIRRRLERVARVLVLSESWKRYIGEIAPGARIVAVPNYVDVPPAVDPRSRDGRALLFLGLVGNRKGVFDLIPAFAAVHRQVPDARMTIAGNGDVERARAEADRLGLVDAVALPGWTGGDAKTALLQTAGIYVLPSYNEGLPMSVLEAMACGLPVITTRVGGIPELIEHGRNGLLIDAGDREQLASAMALLLGDDALRLRMGECARQTVEQGYCAAVTLPLLHQLYADLARHP